MGRDPEGTQVASRLAVVAAVAAGLLATGCASGGASPEAAGGDCPVDPIAVVATVGQWGGIVGDLAGDCAAVDTVIAGSAGDPHDYEPTTADAALFARAALVVRNGLGYDAWAEPILATMPQRPAVVDTGTVAGLQDGDDPHLWYDPAVVEAVAAAVTAELREQMPAAAAYLDAQHAAWRDATQPYRDAIAGVGVRAAGRTFVATEPVFDRMASALGLVDRTPPGYESAVANGADPAPGDVHAFEQLLQSRSVDLLVYNPQTESALSERMRSMAQAAGVAVVEATETAPPGAGGFAQWQTGQLEAVADALEQG